MQHLFSEFKPVTAAEWKAQLVKDLKGESPDSLVWKNENGFNIQPFYTAEDLKQDYEPAFTHADWDICVKGKSSDAKTLNTQLLKDLNSGASSLFLPNGNLDLETALQGIQLNYIRSGFQVDVMQALKLKLFLEKNYDPAEINCSLFPKKFSSEQDLQDWKQVTDAFRYQKNIYTLSFDALPFHNLNCQAYYEVALILSGLNEYLNALPGNSLPESPVVIKTGVNSDYFIQMAKLRAIRRLWKLLAADYKITNGLHLVVETSSTNKSISDSYNNLLRTTVESMAAVAGGCNELIVTGFDLFHPANKTLSERMAINQQLILKEESYLDKMADVACGSYYLESITDAIAARALETMKQMEANGGYFKCLENNSIEKEISIQAKQKEALIADQKQIAIGVNKFRNEKENIRLDAAELAKLEQMPLNNPVLDFELGHYFKHHA
jgi:methylmalonyl-CoA mutase